MLIKEECCCCLKAEALLFSLYCMFRHNKIFWVQLNFCENAGSGWQHYKTLAGKELNPYVKQFIPLEKTKYLAYRFDWNVKGRNLQYVQQIGSQVSILFSINYYKIEFYTFFYN